MPVARPKRFLAVKQCNRCEQTKPAELFCKVRGGGTTDVCDECKRTAVSEAMKQRYAKEKNIFRRHQQEHFDKDLKAQQDRWDSLPDGHPYKAPTRPGAKVSN